MEARALVVTERQPGLLQAVRNLFLEYSRLLLQVAECDLTAFQDFQDELRELPGRYGEERGGVLILLAHISTPALLTEAAACRCLGTVQVPRAAAADTFVGCVALKRLVRCVPALRLLLPRALTGGVGGCISAAEHAKHG